MSKSEGVIRLTDAPVRLYINGPEFSYCPTAWPNKKSARLGMQEVARSWLEMGSGDHLVALISDGKTDSKYVITKLIKIKRELL